MVPFTSLGEDSSQNSSSTKKLRLACDVCHAAKTRCCGNSPCARCVRCGTRCVYSQSNRAGRPKGTRNKKSIDSSKTNGDQCDSTSSPQQEQQNQTQEQQQPTSGSGVLNRSSSYCSDNGNTLSKATSSMSSFTGPSFSPPLEHSQMHSQQQKYVSNMAFDFNPTTDFSDHSNGMYSSLSSQGHMIFPLGPDDMNLDPMDIQAVFDLDFNLDDLQRGCNMPNLVDASGGLMSDTLRDYIPPLPEHDDMAYPNSIQAYSEPLSKTSTNSHSNSNSNSNSLGGSGSPAMPQSRDSYDSAISMGATKSNQGTSASPPCFLPDNISLAELRCQCLQRHVQFLSHLQELLQGFDQLPLDMVLNGVDQGLKVWDLCVQCRMCQQDRNREVLLLSVTSIRTVARILHKASQRIFNKQSHVDSDEQRVSTAKSCADGESHSNNARFTFGSYEIKGEESWLVLGVILTRMLAKIQGVLVSFKKSLNSPNCRKGDGHAGDNSADYLHKLLEGLQANIHVLSASLMGGI